MTLAVDIAYTLSHISVEAYMSGLSEGQPLHYTSGNKTQGNAPRIEYKDGTVPDFIPQLSHKDSDAAVMKKLEVVCTVFYAFRKARQDKENQK